MIVKKILKNNEVESGYHIGIDVFKQTAYNDDTVVETYFDSDEEVNTLLALVYAIQSVAEYCNLDERQLLKLIAGIYRIDDDVNFSPSNEIDESNYDTFDDTDESRFDLDYIPQ